MLNETEINQEVSGVTIAGHHFRRQEAQQLLIVDHRQIISCTPTEYRLLGRLLTPTGCVPYASLIALLDEPPARTRTRLHHIISTLREKLWPFDIQIASVTGIGYLLLPLTANEEESLG